MSDDDLVRRGDARDFLTARLDAALAKRGVANHRAMTDAVLADVVPALPSASAPAERLARAADAWERELSNPYSGADSWARSTRAAAEMREALAAFRAAPEPASKAAWVCAICDGGPANDCACSCPDGGKREPAKPEPCRTCEGREMVWSPTRSSEAIPCPACRPGGGA